ncbi:MAG: YbaK/EbsC family protein [Candidatus Thiodiazotropha sp.]
MSMSQTLRSFLDRSAIPYEVITHRHTRSSMESAGAAHIDSDHLAKAVIVKQDDEYLMVVVPSDYRVHLGKLHHLLGAVVGLATEPELVSLFPDCEGGAIPPLGTAYRMITLVDGDLLSQSEIFFESGDHEHLIKVSGTGFTHLLGDAEKVNVSRPH